MRFKTKMKMEIEVVCTREVRMILSSSKHPNDYWIID
jgi:hypothetical protein